MSQQQKVVAVDRYFKNDMFLDYADESFEDYFSDSDICAVWRKLTLAER